VASGSVDPFHIYISILPSYLVKMKDPSRKGKGSDCSKQAKQISNPWSSVSAPLHLLSSNLTTIFSPKTLFPSKSHLSISQMTKSSLRFTAKPNALRSFVNSLLQLLHQLLLDPAMTAFLPILKSLKPKSPIQESVPLSLSLSLSLSFMEKPLCEIQVIYFR